jgi:hypothetical protein
MWIPHQFCSHLPEKLEWSDLKWVNVRTSVNLLDIKIGLPSCIEVLEIRKGTSRPYTDETVDSFMDRSIQRNAVQMRMIYTRPRFVAPHGTMFEEYDWLGIGALKQVANTLLFEVQSSQKFFPTASVTRAVSRGCQQEVPFR